MAKQCVRGAKNVRLPVEVAEGLAARAESLGLTLPRYMQLLTRRFDDVDLLVLESMKAAVSDQIGQRRPRANHAASAGSRGGVSGRSVRLGRAAPSGGCRAGVAGFRRAAAGRFGGGFHGPGRREAGTRADRSAPPQARWAGGAVGGAFGLTGPRPPRVLKPPRRPGPGLRNGGSDECPGPRPVGCADRWISCADLGRCPDRDRNRRRSVPVDWSVL